MVILRMLNFIYILPCQPHWLGLGTTRTHWSRDLD